MTESIAQALESLDWSGASIGHKAVLKEAVAALRAASPTPPADADLKAENEPASDGLLAHMEQFWSHYGKPPHLREVNTTILREDFKALMARVRFAEAKNERLQDQLSACMEMVDPSAMELGTYKARATAAEAREKTLRDKIAKACEWYWPADDTSSDMCADGVWGVRDNVDLQPGEILHYATGGVVNYGYYAFLEAAEDADSDDEFEVDAPTEEEVRAAIDAELARRAALKGGA